MFFAKFRNKLSVRDESVIQFRVWITDIDVSIMNHAAILTVMEMGRIDFMVRSGFLRLAKKKKWYFVSAALSAQFIRPLKIFQKASLTTRVFHIEDPWIYMEQKITRAGKDLAVCIVKSKVKKGRETVSTDEIAKELNSGPLPAEGEEIVACYEQENNLVRQRVFK